MPLDVALIRSEGTSHKALSARTSRTNSCCHQIMIGICTASSLDSDATQEARTSLEAAVADSISSGAHCTDAELGERHLRLGRVLWSLGGRYREDRTFAHRQWLHCAALWGPAQVCLQMDFNLSLQNLRDCVESCTSRKRCIPSC